MWGLITTATRYKIFRISVVTIIGLVISSGARADYTVPDTQNMLKSWGCKNFLGRTNEFICPSEPLNLLFFTCRSLLTQKAAFATGISADAWPFYVYKCVLAGSQDISQTSN